MASGNVTSAMVAAVIVPKITADPKRRVGGNVDNPKIPNPTQIRSVAANTGLMIWLRAWDQLSRRPSPPL
jgi:hypothetical protein